MCTTPDFDDYAKTLAISLAEVTGVVKKLPGGRLLDMDEIHPEILKALDMFELLADSMVRRGWGL